MDEILKLERTRLPCLRGINKGKLKSAVKKVDILLGKIEVANITTTNDIIYAGAALVPGMVEDQSKKSHGGNGGRKNKLKK